MVSWLTVLLATRETHPAPDAPPATRQPSAFQTLFTDRRVRLLFLVNFLLYLAIFGFFRLPLYPLYLVDEFALGVSAESEFVAYVAVPIVIANLGLIRWLSTKARPQTLTVVSGAVVGVVMIVIPVPGTLGSMWVTLGLAAFALAICLPSAAAMISLAVPGAEQGRILGVNQSLQVGAEALAGISGGLLAAILIPAPLVAFGVAALVGAGLLLSSLRRHRTGATVQ